MAPARQRGQPNPKALVVCDGELNQIEAGGYTPQPECIGSVISQRQTLRVTPTSRLVVEAQPTLMTHFA